jgi:hypothetical protein
LIKNLKNSLSGHEGYLHGTCKVEMVQEENFSS